MIGLVGLISLGGCSRPFWRTQADFDTYNVLMEKTTDPRWDVPRITVEADPRARIYDPFDLDYAPLPPDDAAANEYMHYVDGMKGYKSWHKFGETMSVENPQWMSQFEITPQDFQIGWLQDGADAGTSSAYPVPTIRNLTLEQAVEFANINNRDYQTTLENTYLSALALTFQRFQFNVRYLGLNGLPPTSNLNYFNVPGVSDELQFTNRFGVSQLLPTGGQWVAELANNTLWMFSAGGQTNSASVLSFSLVQPLLAGAGRKVVLENLTFNERQVLYNLRTLARFRKIFFSNTVINDNGSGGGFLGLLAQIQRVENVRFNLRELRVQLEKLQAAYSQKPDKLFGPLETLPDGFEIPQDLADVFKYDPDEKVLLWLGPMLEEDQRRLIGLSTDNEYRRIIRSMWAAYNTDVITTDLAQLLTQEASTVNQLRSAEADLLLSIDNFKLQLGLPTDFQITLDTSLLKPFELIDPRINALEDRIRLVVQEFTNVSSDEPAYDDLRFISRRLEILRKTLADEGLGILAEDAAREERNRPKRLERLHIEADREQVLKNVERDRNLLEQCEWATNEIRLNLQQALRDTDAVETEGEQLSTDTEALDGVWKSLTDEQRVQQFVAFDEQRKSILKRRRAFETRRKDVLGALLNAREDLLQIIGSMKVVQVGLRSELITLAEFDLSLDAVIAAALENRLDLMNSRAAVMDARRAMEVAANRMQGLLSVVTRGDIRNSGGNTPFDFRGDQSTFQVGLQFTAPLDQVLVRNNYRSSLVAYQQAKRAYMQLEDTIKRDVRQEWRQLKLQQANFETSRQNLRYSAIQLDVTVETTFQPSQSAYSNLPQTGAGLRTPGANAGLNLTQALQRILNAQNDLIGTWLIYERNRINIYRDMDIMQIDERGLWIDPVYQSPATIDPTPASEPAHVIPPEVTLRAGRFRIPDDGNVKILKIAAPESEDVALRPVRLDRDRRLQFHLGTQRRHVDP